ncbi:MAG TPA: hypothetical protein DD671_12035, partial [Balneolaceae bacterium]|nr:hypothetical protein [Balneolaceae bacterium]
MKKTDTIEQNKRIKSSWSTHLKYLSWFVLPLLIIVTTSFEGLAQKGALVLDGDGDYATASHNASLDVSET